jgi:hypothetical protein
MPRWYKGFRCVGMPKVLVNQIGHVVQQHDLGKIVPFVRMEKRARPGEFYFFCVY